jgi:hypothetical protein
MFGQRDSIGKYIVQQYVAATGGQGALNSLKNMYAMGEVRINGSDMRHGADDNSVNSRGKAEVGGFVLWQQNPDLWCLELVVSGFKITAGSNGKVSWNQSSSQPFHSNKGPPRPLRRCFQVIIFIMHISFMKYTTICSFCALFHSLCTYSAMKLGFLLSVGSRIHALIHIVDH